jgi:hypothetical protein
MRFSDAVLVALIAAFPAIVAAVLGYLNGRAIKDVHVSLNSRLTELISASTDAGRIAERTEQRQRGDDAGKV